MTPLRTALTPPALVVAGLRTALVQAVPNLSFVYDPRLGWPEAAKAQRAQRDMQEDTTEEGAIPDQTAPNQTQFPLMAWTRTTLIPMQGRTRRNTAHAYSSVTQTGQEWAVEVFQGQLTFRWKIFSRDILELEAIEMGYVTHALISDITGFAIPVPSLYPAPDVNHPAPASWTFDTQWDPLKDHIEIERHPSELFALEGSATIRGFFLTGLAVPLSVINTIDLKIMNYDHGLLDEVVVTRG